MRRCFRLAAGLTLTLGALAQHSGIYTGGHAPRRTYGSPSGFGNILFPGVGTPPPLDWRPDSAYRSRQVSGISPARPQAPRSHAAAYPVYIGGWGYGWTPEPAPAPAPAPAAPPVIINQYFTADAVRPQMRDYTSDPPPSAYRAPSRRQDPEDMDDAPTLYLIAFKDQSIHTALGFWVEGDTLHYISGQANHNRASLSLVDRELSLRLNRERGLEFTLTAE